MVGTGVGVGVGVTDGVAVAVLTAAVWIAGGAEVTHPERAIIATAPKATAVRRVDLSFIITGRTYRGCTPGATAGSSGADVEESESTQVTRLHLRRNLLVDFEQSRC